MPPTGSGQSRRSHTKSRKGCRTCKRRHIRCDETFSQCRNCTKHNVRCDYMDAAPTGETRPIQETPDLNITPQIQQELDTWRSTGVYPFPNLGVINQPTPERYTQVDLRLIHHISSVATQMQRTEPNKYAIWTKRVPLFLKIASSNDFVMGALLALSASHLSWLQKCPATLHLAYQHRGMALKGLQEAIGDFSKDNSDAVLAASILLSWQATDWRGWASLMQGTSTVIDAMQEWKHDSDFGEFMEEKDVFTRGSLIRPLIVDPDRDSRVLVHVYASLKRLEPLVEGKQAETQGLHDLLSFIQTLQTCLPVDTADEQFEFLQPLRAWLFLLPMDFLRRVKQDPSVMLVLAYFYGVALAVEPLFPAVGAAYFGSMSVGPIEEIHQTLVRLSEASPTEELKWCIGLMSFPLEMVHEFRLRMDLRTIEEIDSPDTDDPMSGVDLVKNDGPSSCTSAEGFDASAFGAFGMSSNPITHSVHVTPTSVGYNSNWGTLATSGFMMSTMWRNED